MSSHIRRRSGTDWSHAGPDDVRMPRRRRNRIDGFDYAAHGAYFVTVCVAGRRSLLGAMEGDGVLLSPLGAIALECLRAVPNHHDGVKVDEHIVMPDHVHAIVVLVGAGPTLATIVGTFKAAVTRRSGERDFWQRGFHDHVVRDEDDLRRLREYIRTNPLRTRHPLS